MPQTFKRFPCEHVQTRVKTFYIWIAFSGTFLHHSINNPENNLEMCTNLHQ